MLTTILGRPSATPPPARRSYENPAVPLSQADTWATNLLGGTTAAGVPISEERALTYGPVFRATALLTNAVARLPAGVYRRESDESGNKNKDKDHPAWNLVERFGRPSPWMNQWNFRCVMMPRLILRGNAYALIVRNAAGRPLELIPLTPKTEPRIHDGKLLYRTELNGEGVVLLPRQVLHLRTLGDELEGWSVLRFARESIGLGLAAEKFGAKYFSQGGRVGMALEHPGQLSEAARDNILRSFEARYVGLENVHRPMVLEEGMKLHPFTVSNEDAQFLETRGFQARDVAIWFGVPPHKLGDEARTSYASLEQENQSFVDDSLDPFLSVWESEWNAKLRTAEEADRDSHICEFNRTALVRADVTARGAFYKSGLEGGWLSPDEVRARENLNAIPDGKGKIYFRPLNMATTEDPPPQPKDQTPPPPPGGPAEPPATDEGESASRSDPPPPALETHLREVLRQALGRACGRVANSLRRRGGSLTAREEALAGLEAQHGQVIEEMLSPVVAAILAAGEGRSVTEIKQEIFDRARELARGISGELPGDFDQKILDRLEV